MKRETTQTLMVSASSVEGVASIVTLFICTCAFLRRNPRLRVLLDKEKTGVFSLVHKAALIGMRLPNALAVVCLALAFNIAFG